MADAAVKNLRELNRIRSEIAEKCYPAFDEQLLFALERRHLDVPAYVDLLMHKPEDEGEPSLAEHLQRNVRLLQLDEISFNDDQPIHLPGVESALTAMRGCGYSLLFLVQGKATGTSVYLGISRFSSETPDDASAVRDRYESVWKANFPGTKVVNLDSEKIATVSHDLSDCGEFGVLTGIPSLKREEESKVFVQGLERLIRAMRGKTYCWISIADPIPQSVIREAIDSCRQLQSEIHQYVKTDLSKATSNGKTIMFGLFGMMGEGKSEGSSKSDSETTTEGTSRTDSTSQTDTTGDTHSTSNTAGGSIFASGGASIGFLGTGGHVEAGASVDYHRTWGDAHSVSKSIGTSIANGVMSSLAKGWVNTVTQSVSSQLGGGAFSSFAYTMTKTTTVGQELLNRKAEYAEEVLQAYEKRLQEGTALGMWNLGHYFCAADPASYNLGIGVVTSLFSGMDSTYEPPRAIKMPAEFRDVLRRFKNVYLVFGSKEKGEKVFRNHPLGIFFNGPATPVNTRELAIATPIATQDVEGVSVSRRPGFGINRPQGSRMAGKPSLTVGQILDRGNHTGQMYHLSLENLPKHVAVFGLTGSGKTNTVHQMLLQLWKNQHIPFLVIEPAKAEYRALATMDEFKDDLLVISAGVDRTASCPLRLNPFAFDPGNDTDAHRVHVLTHIDRLKATFNASFPMYASMPYILEEAILEVYRDRGWDLGRSENRFVDIYHEDFQDYVPTLQDLYWKVDEVVNRKGYFQEQTMNIKAALKARLSSLMVGAKGTMFNCAKSIPAADLFSRPVVIELENLGDDDEKAFLMGLLVSRLYEYRKAQFRSEPGAAHPFQHVLVIEEAHRLLANIPDTSANPESANPRGKAVSAFVDMLAEVRALGQSVFVVDQLPSRVNPNIVKGTGTKIVHRLLAKDDRESVGWTMGLTEGQIDDICLFRTGECAVNQDGDLTSYQCRVKKCEAHEDRTGGEESAASTAFRHDHEDMFRLESSDVDMEDALFKDDLYKTMLLIGLGQAPEAALAALHPCRRKKAWTDRNGWLEVYWKQVCAEIWSFHGGAYGDFLALRKEGRNVLQGGDATAYREAFQAYFDGSRVMPQSRTGRLAGVAYDSIFLAQRVMERINERFEAEKDCPDRRDRLAAAIRRTLPVLLPTGLVPDSMVRNALVEEIVERIAPSAVAEVLEIIMKGK